MDLTPKFAKMDFSEDSGCGTASSMEISSSLYESTPSISQHTNSSIPSRKRKIPYASVHPHKIATESLTFDTPKASPWLCTTTAKDFLSSTLNESRDVEHFINDNLTPNFYMEREEFTSSTIGSHTGNLEKPMSVTPPRVNESCKLVDHLNLSHPKANSNQKLGSPERNEILYPNLKHFGSPYKPPTPQKLAENIKRYTPAKKRLFGVTKREKLDPFAFFMNDKHQFHNIVEKLFSYLDDKDLYNVKLVSAKWRRTISISKVASKRLGDFLKYWNLNKENMVNHRLLSEMYSPSSPIKSPPSPRSKKFYRFMEVGQCLKDGQKLNKCPQCDYPSIIDQNISQCQREACGYIHCIYCNSFSTKGPENFIDQCQTSKLVIEKPEKTKLQALLSDSPIKDSSEGEVPSFLLRDSSFNSSLQNSSGYITDTELTYSKILNSSLKEKSNILQDCNRDLISTRKSVTRRSSLASVVPLNSTREEIMEPSSPPKIKNVRIGSKASKKNLKRLFSS